MLKRSRFDVLGASRRDFLPVFVLLLNSFIWFNMTFLMIDKFLNAYHLTVLGAFEIWVVYSVSVIGSSIIGSVLSRPQKFAFLRWWMILGVLSSLLPVLLITSSYIWSFALGFSLGLGMPECLAYFAASSTIENRGRMSGTIFLGIYLSAALLSIVFSFLDLTLGFILLAIWRGAGLILFTLIKPKFVTLEKSKSISFKQVFEDRRFRLYLVPWIMFILIDRFEGPILESFLNNPSMSIAVIIGPISGSLAAFIGGYLSDRVGRKRVVIAGFVALGLAYAAIGIAPNTLISWYFYTVADGIAWGILMVTFLLTLWGDLSQSGGREKYYVIGGTPFYFTSILGSIFASYVMQIPAYAAFSLASLFLFISVLPLLYAPETLPEKKIEMIRLKGYIEQAKKAKEEYASEPRAR